MKMFNLCLLSLLIGVTHAGEVCYSDIGCFDNAPPFTDATNRPLTMLPQDRDLINTVFALNTPTNRKYANQQILSNQDLATISSSDFDFYIQTKFLIHGYIELDDITWMNDMNDAILAEGNYNVIRVIWSLQPTGNEHYGQMSSNARIVGAEIALLIDQIMSLAPVGSTASDPANYHLIGRGLGAHVAGYAGERHSPKLGRISGIDPAGPYFEEMDLIVRLDHTDAEFVDVIHTDVDDDRRIGMGIDQNIGHADFYPNGGRDQPSCRGVIVKTVVYIAGAIYDGGVEYHRCDHEVAYELYLESIHSFCPFMASPTPDRNINNYVDGLDDYWDPENAMPMGYYADSSYKKTQSQYHQSYITQTKDETREEDEPHCKTQYRARIYFDDPLFSETTYGDLYISYGTPGNLFTENILHSNTARNNRYETGQDYYVTGFGMAYADQLSQLKFYWEWDRDAYNPLTWNFIGNPETYVPIIDVDSLEAGQSEHFCNSERDAKVESERDTVVFNSDSCSLFE